MLPMHEAPTDGKYVILFFPSNNHLTPYEVTTARYSKQYDLAKWRTTDDYSVTARFGEPIAWIPMP